MDKDGKECAQELLKVIDLLKQDNKIQEKQLDALKAIPHTCPDKCTRCDIGYVLENADNE